MSLRDFEVDTENLLLIVIPWHDQFSHLTEWRELLSSDVEVVCQVDLFVLLATFLVHLEIVVVASHIDVSESELEDDGPHVWWKIHYWCRASLLVAKLWVELYSF